MGPHRNLNFWQINLHHCQAASATLARTMVDLEIDVALIQEPWLGKAGRIQGLPAALGTRYQIRRTERTRSCIIVRKGVLSTFLPQFSSEDFCVVEIGQGAGSLIVVSAYMPYEMSTPVDDRIREVVKYCKQKSKCLIMGCDANAHNLLWGSTNTNNRGELLAEFVLCENLEVLNRGSEHTFANRLRKETIDVTIASIRHADRITGWKVSSEMTRSDHRAITFQVGYGKKSRDVQRVRLPRGTRVGDYRLVLEEELDKLGPPGLISDTNGIEYSCKAVSQAIIKAYHAANTPIIRDQANPTPWWNDELENLRKEIRHLYNRAYRCGEPHMWDDYYKESKRYCKLIRKSKRDTWRSFCDSIETVSEINRLRKITSQEQACKLGVVRKSDNTLTDCLKETAEVMISTHFPGSERVSKPLTFNRTIKSVDRRFAKRMVTLDKVTAAVNSFDSFKTPGPDGIFPALLQWGGKSLWKWLVEIYRACLGTSHCPAVWREANVVFLPKAGKEDYTLPKSHRAISLTSFMLKGMEKVCADWLWENTLAENPFHVDQHAYMAGKSTESALHRLVSVVEDALASQQDALAVFMDIEGAFDKVDHRNLKAALTGRGVHPTLTRWIYNTLRSRVVCVKLGPIQARATVTQGCPQGGVLSPLLWNCAVDSLISKLNGNGLICIGYADDVAIISRGPVLSTTVDVMQNGLRVTETWCRDMKLSVNPLKTGLILFTNRRSPVHDSLLLYGKAVKETQQVTYLGVTLDAKLSWKSHLDSKISSCKRIMHMCRSVVGRKWGISPKCTQWTYDMIVKPALMYASIVWWKRVDFVNDVRALKSLQGLACRSISGAFRTAPIAGLEALLGMPPLELQIKGRAMKTALRMMDNETWKPMRADGHAAILGLFQRSRPELLMPRDVMKVRRMQSLQKPSIITTGILKVENDDIIIVYTDGSFMRGSGGAGVNIPQLHVEESFQLGKLTNVFQCEVLAVIKALDILLDMKVARREIILAIDSQAAIRSIDSEKVNSKLVEEAKSKMNKFATSNGVTMFWIKAHVGQSGNEDVDMLAKAGTSKTFTGPLPVMAIPKASVNQAIADWERARHRRMWTVTEDCRQTRMFLWNPIVVEKKRILGLSRTALSRLAECVTGHGAWNKHPFRMGLVDDDICPRCLEDMDTAEHCFCECPALTTARKEIYGVKTLSGRSLGSFSIWKHYKYSRRIVFE